MGSDLDDIIDKGLEQLQDENAQLKAEYRAINGCYEVAISQCEKLKAELAQCQQDLKDAAGELAVPIPEAGTDMARLLSANVLLRQREARLWELLREAVQCFCVTQKPADYPVDSWINKALTELRRPEEAGT